MHCQPHHPSPCLRATILEGKAPQDSLAHSPPILSYPHLWSWAWCFISICFISDAEDFCRLMPTSSTRIKMLRCKISHNHDGHQFCSTHYAPGPEVSPLCALSHLPLTAANVGHYCVPHFSSKKTGSWRFSSFAHSPLLALVPCSLKQPCR